MASMIAPIPRTTLALAFLTAVTLSASFAGAAEADESNAEMAIGEASVNAESLGESDIRPELIVETELPARRLTLDEALALAVKHNLGVEVARYEPLIAEQDMEGAWGAYDPVLNADIGSQLSETPNTFILNPVSRSQQRVVSGGASLSGLLPYVGATLGIELESGRTQTNSGIERFQPRYDSSLFLTARIPLLRGLIWNEPWTQVKVRKIGYQTSVDGFRESVMDISESTINLYWTLVANQEQYGVARKSLETALALLDQTRTQYEVGVVSKVEVVEAEAGVADREFNLIVARNDFENSEDNLVDAVLSRDLKATMDFRIQPADDPEDYEAKDVDVERSIAIALRNLPELSAAERLIEQREIELKFAKNSMLPQFDVDGRYGFVNVSGDERSATPTNTGYSRSYDDLFSEDGFENYTVTGVFSIPIPNRTARRNVARGELDLRRAKTLKVREQQNVILDVRRAARGILASAQGIEAAERRRLAAEEQLRAERIRLEHGESTPFEVLQRESDLVDAESQKITALRRYREADARLDRAQGTILETYRIQVDGVRDDPMR